MVFSIADGLKVGVVAVVAVMMLGSMVLGEEVVVWDFSKGVQGWTGNGQVTGMEVTSEGIVVTTSGGDPWIEGPAVDMPGGRVTRVTVRMRSDFDENAELFYGTSFQPGKSRRFMVRGGGKWRDYSVMINERLGAKTRFRLDPCVQAAELLIGSIRVETIGVVARPELDKPSLASAGKVTAIGSGAVELLQYGDKWGGFAVRVDGRVMAGGYRGEVIGVMEADESEWLKLGDAETVVSAQADKAIAITAKITDKAGARWEIVRRFEVGRDGSIAVETAVKVDADRALVHVPWLTMFPGLGTFGAKKQQGLFAGMEYLADEPSSSEADLVGPGHVRRTPDPVMITFPLMAISQGGGYVGVVWDKSDMVAATFDSPDTIYGSQSHVMALSGPGVGENRFEHEFAAHSPVAIKAGQWLKARFTIIGGAGETVVEAVKHYVRLKGLPAAPKFKGGYDGAVELLAHGWLDSKINVGGQFRHAVWNDNFKPQPAADASMYVDFLSTQTKDVDLKRRLVELRELGLSKIGGDDAYTGTISHARLLNSPLVFGRVREFAAYARRSAFGQLGGFDNEGVKHYSAGKADYGKTHFADHANGFGGRSLVFVLEGAVISGDKNLIADALELLDKQTVLYGGTVPRGAQTWEIPLHTPDVMASAHMVKAYTLGYMISGKAEHLEQAKYWAWTGVPFVYLENPTDGEIGTYSTIAVLGATNWQAPVWFGQPVQWCGLVYASALQSLAEYDRQGPWKQIADGITLSGMQQTWPQDDGDRQGLLPDFFHLREQVSDGPAINPGTVQAHLPEAYGKGKLYDVKKVAGKDWFLHGPCAIKHLSPRDSGVAFVTDGWGDRWYYVLISGVRAEPVSILASIENAPRKTLIFEKCDYEFHGDEEILILKLKGQAEVVIRY